MMKCQTCIELYINTGTVFRAKSGENFAENIFTSPCLTGKANTVNKIFQKYLYIQCTIIILTMLL